MKMRYFCHTVTVGRSFDWLWRRYILPKMALLRQRLTTESKDKTDLADLMSTQDYSCTVMILLCITLCM